MLEMKQVCCEKQIVADKTVCLSNDFRASPVQTQNKQSGIIETVHCTGLYTLTGTAVTKRYKRNGAAGTGFITLKERQ